MTLTTDHTFANLSTPGEVFLAATDLSYTDRIASLKSNNFFNIEEAVCIGSPTLGMEDVARAIGEIQKKAGGLKTVFIVFDQMTLPAQNAFLKTLEDVDVDTCIILYVSKQTTLTSTVVSRVVSVEIEEGAVEHKIFFSYKKITTEKLISKRYEMLKPIVKAYDLDEISKQDIVSWLSRMYRETDDRWARDVLSESIILLQQQSVLVKYVLEYMVSFL